MTATDKTLTNQYGEASRHTLLRRVRVQKSESAFVYAVFEACEGIMAYSTLDTEDPHQLHRDLELQIPAGFVEEAEAVLERLADLVYDLGWTTELAEICKPKHNPKLSPKP
ncbi:MAG: hypothetical protein JNL01_14935 [Bdellovibrionales bacterium]|nr:hypothetical protein [Bdellovibrionales bacterium]